MLGWASQKLSQISQTVAPPPADANGRFVYALQQGDEDGAMACVHEMDVARAVLHPTKRSYAIHLACLHSMDRLIRMLLTVPGVDLTFIDSVGNTPLHYACMSAERERALPTIKMLVTEFKASVIAKNSMNQTPYDLATLDGVRQFLLPLQLQEETRIAIDNGGVGLPPGIDMGGLRIANPAAPPPPIMPMGAPMAPAPMSSPAPQVYQTQAQPPQASTPAGEIQKPPSSGEAAGYARVGGSSAAIYKPAGRTYVKADGFHSSSSDVNLQRKYGHVQANYSNVPPPPSSGNAPSAYAAPTGGANPYAGGTNPYASGRANQRYVSYNAVTGRTQAAPRTAPSAYTSYAAAQANAVPNVAVFTPGETPAAPASGQNSNMAAYSPAPVGYGQTAYAPQDTMASPAPQQQGYPGGQMQAQQQFQPAGTPYGAQNYNAGQQQQPPFSPAAQPPISGGLTPGKTDPGVAASLFSSPPSGGVGFSAPAPAAGNAGFSSPPSGGVGFSSPAPKDAAASLFGSPAAQAAPTQQAPANNDSQPGVDTASSMFASQPGSAADASNVFGTPAEADQTVPTQAASDSVAQTEPPKEEPSAAQPTSANEVSTNEPSMNRLDSDVDTSLFSSFANSDADQNGPASDAPKENGSAAGQDGAAPAESAGTNGGIDQGSAAEEKPSTESSTALPAGWKELMDPSSGRPYYYNENDGTTSWDRPAAAPENTETAPLPAGWREVIDPGSGRPYYYNEVDNTTSWDRPMAPTGDSQPQSSEVQAEKNQGGAPTSNEATTVESESAPSAASPFSVGAQQGEVASQLFGSAPNLQTTAQETAGSVFGSPVGNESTSSDAAAAVFGAASASSTNFSGGVAENKSTPGALPDLGNTEPATNPPAQAPAVGVSPTSGGFSLNDIAKNSSVAADVFSSASKSEDVSPTKEPEKQGQSSDKPGTGERAGSPDGSEEGLDDVPLSPDAPAHPPVNLAPSDASSAFSSPPPVQPAANMGFAATPGGHQSMFDAIGLPPPPFSSKK